MSFRDRQRLKTAIDSARNEALSPQLSDENKARLAQLMTVLASGYLETTCREVMLAYTQGRAQPNIVNFVSHKLSRIPNPKMENILQLIREFDQDVANKLERFSDGEIKESVNSIVGIRNQIVHGRSASISVARITQYFDNARKLARKMEELLK